MKFKHTIEKAFQEAVIALLQQVKNFTEQDLKELKEFGVEITETKITVGGKPMDPALLGWILKKKREETGKTWKRHLKFKKKERQPNIQVADRVRIMSK